MQFFIKGTSGESLYGSTYVSSICLPLVSQKTEVVKQMYDNFKEIRLADSNPNSDLDVDTLIGGDFYWNVACDSFARLYEVIRANSIVN